MLESNHLGLSNWYLVNSQLLWWPQKVEALVSANQGFHQVAVLFNFSLAHLALRYL